MNKVLLMIAFSAVLFSCSKDEDPAPAKSLEEVSLSLTASGTATPVEAPAAMASSNDIYAQQATAYVAQVNGITTYLSYLKPSKNAVKSSTRITASNGRVAATQTDYLVYTWSDGQGNSAAYQVSEQSGKYVFEVFTKIGNKDWMLLLYAEEKTDGSEGLMKIYNTAGDGELLITYTWKHNGDLLDLVMTSDAQGIDFKVVISINKKTKAGSVTYTLDGDKLYNMTWDAKGNGSWVWYDDEDGSVIDEGTWTV